MAGIGPGSQGDPCLKGNPQSPGSHKGITGQLQRWAVSVVQVSTGRYGNKEERHPAWLGWAQDGVCVQEGFLAEMSLDLGLEAQAHISQEVKRVGCLPTAEGMWKGMEGSMWMFREQTWFGMPCWGMGLGVGEAGRGSNLNYAG